MRARTGKPGKRELADEFRRWQEFSGDDYDDLKVPLRLTKT